MGALGVGMGAFGAHLLRSLLPLQVMAIYETAVWYHLVHTLALLGCGILLSVHPERAATLRWCAGLFTAGIVLFSGSLYALALTGLPIFGPLTPLGGLSWIAAWGLLAWSFLRGK